MSKGITQGSMLGVLPGVLSRDEGMNGLAKLIGWTMEDFSGKVDAPAIFQHIDKLPEDLLDLLANDLKVDWYDFDGDIATKRRQIKSSWSVHEHMGTVGAVRTALQSVWPDTSLEEWFEYDGEPGCFRVFLSTDESGTIDFAKAVRMINIFKPVRAHIDGYAGIRISCGIVIETGKFLKTYHPAKCGTKPRRKSHGAKDNEGLTVGTEMRTAKYHVKYCGTPLGALM